MQTHTMEEYKYGSVCMFQYMYECISVIYIHMYIHHNFTLRGKLIPQDALWNKIPGQGEERGNET